MPCYNGEDYIGAAIKSVLEQKSTSFELIVVNDGSTDGTQFICDNFNDSRLNVITVENGGAGKARNIGINASCGEWIIFLDSDDLLLSNRITDLYISLLDKYYELGIDIICTPRIKTDMGVLNQPVISYPQQLKDINSHLPMLEFWTCIYRYDFLKKYNIRFYEYRDQDIESAFRYLSFSQATNIIVNNEMYFYLQRTNLSSNTHTWNKYKLSYIKALVYMDILNNKACKEDEEYLQLIVIKSLIYFYLVCIKYGYSTSVGLSNVHDLVKQISTKSKRRSRFLIELRLLDLFRNFLRFRNIFFKCSQEVHCVQEKYDDQYILDNLKRLSDKLECCIDK